MGPLRDRPSSLPRASFACEATALHPLPCPPGRRARGSWKRESRLEGCEGGSVAQKPRGGAERNADPYRALHFLRDLRRVFTKTDAREIRTTPSRTMSELWQGTERRFPEPRAAGSRTAQTSGETRGRRRGSPRARPPGAPRPLRGRPTGSEAPAASEGCGRLQGNAAPQTLVLAAGPPQPGVIFDLGYVLISGEEVS